MDKNRVVYLEITTWVGTALAASHYYGRLWASNSESVDLKHKLTKRQAAELNRDSLFDYGYKAGDFYYGFTSPARLKKLAIATYKAHFPNADILIEGRTAVADPQEILDGPEDLKTFVNDLVDRAKAVGWYDGGNRQAMESIYRAFSKYWKEYK